MELFLIGSSQHYDTIVSIFSTTFEVCGCCGAKLLVSPEQATRIAYLAAYNNGITVTTSDTSINEESDEFWTESIPIGDEFLVIKHRVVSDSEE